MYYVAIISYFFGKNFVKATVLPYTYLIVLTKSQCGKYTDGNYENSLTLLNKNFVKTMVLLMKLLKS